MAGAFFENQRATQHNAILPTHSAHPGLAAPKAVSFPQPCSSLQWVLGFCASCHLRPNIFKQSAHPCSLCLLTNPLQRHNICQTVITP